MRLAFDRLVTLATVTLLAASLPRPTAGTAQDAA
jgi:hypothetical protein